MAIEERVEIIRPPDQVFGYVTDPARFGQWQEGVVSGHIEGNGPAAVGSKCLMTRRIGGANRASTSEITELEPPRIWAIRGIDGPIRADVRVTVEPRGDGARSLLAISVGFRGAGFGRLLAPVIVRQARGEMARNVSKLKALLESGLAD